MATVNAAEEEKTTTEGPAVLPASVKQTASPVEEAIKPTSVTAADDVSHTSVTAVSDDDETTPNLVEVTKVDPGAKKGSENDPGAKQESEKEEGAKQESEKEQASMIATNTKSLPAETKPAPSDVAAVKPAPKDPKPHLPSSSPVKKPPPSPEMIPTTPEPSTAKRPAPLSELSKQLRYLQAKNQAQATEIDRLERQIRILGDLHNVSVGDLRSALMRACQAEAHAELHNRISLLTAQLEAAELSKQRSNAASEKQEIANLQLRVGELEEVEETMRAEIQSLYKKLAGQTAKATRLEAACERQETQIEALHQRAAAAVATAAAATVAANNNNKDESNKVKIVSAPAAVKAAPAAAAAAAATTVTLQQQQEEEEAQAKAQEQAQAAVVEQQVTSEKVALLESQLQSAEKQHTLRQAQFKARFAVQEENIHDMKQQLKSLYVAFGLLKQEREEEAKASAALKSFLDEADAQVAQQTDHLERASLSGSTSAAAMIQREINQQQAAYSSPPQSPVPVGQNIVSPGSGEADADMTPARTDGPMLAAAASPMATATPSATPSSNLVRSSSTGSHGQKVMEGTLLLRSAGGVIKRWKKRQAALYVKFTHYQLVFTNESSSQARIALDLTVGVSAVYPYVNHKHGFSIHSNAYKSLSCQTLFCAATSADDYGKWMNALEVATTGAPAEEDKNSSVAPPRILSAAEQEKRDLELALELSETDH